MILALSETWYMFGLCLAIAVGAWFVFIWAVRSGQFKDTEQTAIDMLELDASDEALPPPASEQDAAAGDDSSTLGGHKTTSGQER